MLGVIFQTISLAHFILFRQFAPLAPLAPLAPNASVDEGEKRRKCIKVIDKQQVIDNVDTLLPLNTPAFGASGASGANWRKAHRWLHLL
jgi:hypothetical protein